MGAKKNFFSADLFFLFADCAMNVHHKCQDKVANLCGINQKLLAEALTQVSQVSSVSHSVEWLTFGIQVHIKMDDITMRKKCDSGVILLTRLCSWRFCDSEW